MKKVLVVPTIREQYIKRFLSAWEGYDFDEIIVVEDNFTKSFDLSDYDIRHYSWKSIRDDLGEHEWIIPRTTDAIRSYGFLKAVVDAGADIIITLDDDCFPEDLDFVERHVEALIDTQVTDGWKATFNHDTLAPRGLPYDTYMHRECVVNVGLWSGVPDIGAVEVLSTFRANPSSRQDNVDLNAGVAGYSRYIPMCGMNLAFKKEVLPLMYFPLMGAMHVDKDLKLIPFRRYGDIWAGLLVQRALQHLRLGMSYGYPLVNHSKASNPYTNLAKEAAGIGVHEKFWRYIDLAVISGDSPYNVYLSLADVIERAPSMLYSHDDVKYWVQLSDAMRTWADICS